MQICQAGLLECGGWTWKGGYFQRGDGNNNFSERGFAPIHLAASQGNYELLKEMISRPDLTGDPYVEDYNGNTALHYALQMGPIKFEAHLLDYVNCEHLRSNDPRSTNERVSENNIDLITPVFKHFRRLPDSECFTQAYSLTTQPTFFQSCPLTNSTQLIFDSGRRNGDTKPEDILMWSIRKINKIAPQCYGKSWPIRNVIE